MKFLDKGSSVKTYLSEILLIQMVATCLVIFGHSYPFTIDIPAWLDRTRQFIYLFHMPLFVWISGYLLIYTQQADRCGASGFARKRFLKLLIPYFALSLIAILPKYAMQPFLNDSVSLDWYSLLRIFFVPRENVWGHFWFLPMIFTLGVLGYFLDKFFGSYKNRKYGWGIITSALFIGYAAVMIYGTPRWGGVTRWLSISDVVQFGWVYALGAFCACNDLLRKIDTPQSRFLAILSFPVAILFFFCEVPNIIAPVKAAAIAVVMIFSLSELCIYVSKKVDVNRNAVYAQTFTIFLLSWPCQAIANVVTERLLHWPYYAIMPIQFCVGIIGPMILIYIIERFENKHNIRWISFILGK